MNQFLKKFRARRQLRQLRELAARVQASMAAPSDSPIKISGLPENEIEKLRTQLNNTIASFRILAAKLDADAGVTDTNYFALTCDSALGAAAPTKLSVL